LTLPAVDVETVPHLLSLYPWQEVD